MNEELQGIRLPQTDVPSREQMTDWLTRARAGDRSARQQIVEANLRLVMSIVNRFRHRGAALDDLFQAGCIAMLEAVDRFDPSYGVAFSTYAVPRIIGHIRHVLRRDTSVKVSRGVYDLAVRAARARERLTQSLGRSPTAAEIAAETDVDATEVVAALDALGPAASLDEVIADRDGDPLRLLDRLRADEEAADEMVIERTALANALRSLDPDARTLIRLRFLRRLRQVEVARMMNVSQAHVSRMERRVLGRLRELLAR